MGVMDVEFVVAMSILAFVFGYLVGVFVESSIEDHCYKKQADELESQLAAAIKERDEWKIMANESNACADRCIEKWEKACDQLQDADDTIDAIICALERYHGETEGEVEE